MLGTLVVMMNARPSQFDQCDSKWALQIIANGKGETICQDPTGQLTALSMIADGCKNDGQNFNPAKLNIWLNETNGFLPDGSIDMHSLEAMKISLVLTSTSVVEVRQKLKYDFYEAIAESDQGEFFTVVSFSANNLMVYDPKSKMS